MTERINIGEVEGKRIPVFDFKSGKAEPITFDPKLGCFLHRDKDILTKADYLILHRNGSATAVRPR